MVEGSSSGSLYYFGKSFGPANEALFMKMSSSDAVVWAYVYDQYGYFYQFDVDPSETYIYFVHYDSSMFPLHRIATSNGAVVDSRKITTFKSDSYYSYLRFSSSGNALYF